MGLTAVVAAVLSSTLLYVGTPRIPTYAVHSPTLQWICPRCLLLGGGRLTATVRAGLEVTNENFLGADVHGARFDIYYEDWEGELRHVGTMRDTDAAGREAEMEKKGASAAKEEDDGGVASKEKEEDRASASPSESPLFAVPARSTSVSSPPDLVTITLTEVPLSLTIKMAYDLLRNFGKLSMLTSGVLHVKGGKPSLPLSVGIVCDNHADLLTLPWKILGRDCDVKSAGAGWGKDIGVAGARLRDRVLTSHRENDGMVLSAQLDRRRADEGRGGGEEGDGAGGWRQNDTEHLIEWHTF